MNNEAVTPSTETTEIKPKAKRGFAAMSAEKRSAISQMGGRKAHALGKAHQFKEGAEAKAVGARGGRASQESRRLKKQEEAGNQP